MEWQLDEPIEDWRLSGETAPVTIPVTGAWREGEHPGDRLFAPVGDLPLEAGGALGDAILAYETWGSLSAARDNAVLILHALTGDSHVIGDAGIGHATPGWWHGVVGPGRAIDTNAMFVVAPNLLGGSQGSTGPSSLAPDGREWGSRFPRITIRDQVEAQRRLAHMLGITTWRAVVGGSMGGMHALEWAVEQPESVEALALVATSAASSAGLIAQCALQAQAITADPRWRGGDYYDAEPGDGPSGGLALARRMAMLGYRSGDELEARFGREWQSAKPPMRGGRFRVESYLDVHGNRFVRRFDAGSYVRLIDAMATHDVGRGRGGIDAALSRVSARTVVAGISSDRLFPLSQQHALAEGIRDNLSGTSAVVLDSPFGHDAFLIEQERVGEVLSRVLS